MKVSGTYTIPYQTEMSVLNLENVYVDVNTSEEAAIITLPKISDMDQRNVKFYVNFDQAVESNFTATIIAANDDTINGSEQIVLQPGDRGFWILVQDIGLWTMASAQFIPASFVGLNATIVYTDGLFSVNVSGGLAPYTIQWSLPQQILRGYTISGATNEQTVTLAERPNTDPNQPAFFVPQTGPSEVRPQLLKVQVTDSIGNVAKDFYYIMAIEVA